METGNNTYTSYYVLRRKWLTVPLHKPCVMEKRHGSKRTAQLYKSCCLKNRKMQITIQRWRKKLLIVIYSGKKDPSEAENTYKVLKKSSLGLIQTVHWQYWKMQGCRCPWHRLQSGTRSSKIFNSYVKWSRRSRSKRFKICRIHYQTSFFLISFTIPMNAAIFSVNFMEFNQKILSEI